MFLTPFWQTSMSRKLIDYITETDLDPRYHVEDDLFLTIKVSSLTSPYNPIVFPASSNEHVWSIVDDTLQLFDTFNLMTIPYYATELPASTSEHIWSVVDDDVKVTGAIIP